MQTTFNAGSPFKTGMSRGNHQVEEMVLDQKAAKQGNQNEYQPRVPIMQSWFIKSSVNNLKI